MSTRAPDDFTAADASPAPRWHRLLTRLCRTYSAQVALWEHTQRGLEPWRDAGPMRWSGARLDGVVLPEHGPPSSAA